MHIPSPEHLLIASRQRPQAPAAAALERIEHLLVLVPQDAPARVWRGLPDGRRLHRLSARASDDGSAIVTTRLDNAGGTAVTVAGVSAEATRYQLLERARALVARAGQDSPASVAVAAAGFTPRLYPAVVECLLLAVQAAAFRMPSFASQADKSRRTTSVTLLGAPRRLELRAVNAVAEGNNLARWFSAMPPNRLDAGTCRRAVSQLARRHGWSMRFLGERALEREGAGAFLAVSQGNADRNAGIVHLRYRPRRSDARPSLALVGKGILFDTGGTNLKHFSGMLDMHMDKSGAGTALGTLLALTRMRVDYPVDCWLAITENRIGPTAYKAQDIITAANGTTIQTVHTDAEGRMVLADTLTLAGREQPGLIMDYATLTGSCVSAVTDRYSGVFTNRPALHDLLVRTGSDCGERVWPFPLDADFDEMLRSETADVMQCAPSGPGDHILAARFLSRFVPEDSCWIHMDMSSGMRRGGLGFVPTRATGFGVLYSVSLLAAQSEGPDDLLTRAA